jgi:hypothetical protein
MFSIGMLKSVRSTSAASHTFAGGWWMNRSLAGGGAIVGGKDGAHAETATTARAPR